MWNDEDINSDTEVSINGQKAQAFNLDNDNYNSSNIDYRELGTGSITTKVSKKLQKRVDEFQALYNELNNRDIKRKMKKLHIYVCIYDCVTYDRNYLASFLKKNDKTSYATKNDDVGLFLFADELRDYLKKYKILKE